MGKPIIKLQHSGVDYFLEWSTITESPNTYGMPLEEFKGWYKEEYGNHGLLELEKRLETVNAKGTSAANDDNVDQTIRVNRAGPNEKQLTKKQIIDTFIVNRPEDE